MSLKKLKISITKLMLPLLFRIFQIFGINTRVINFLSNKKSYANNIYNFEKNIKKLLRDKKLIALDVGSQGGFNSDNFFPTKYNKYFKPILVDPLQSSSVEGENKYYINKGLWSSKGNKKLYILGKRPVSSSMYEPDKKSLKIYGFRESDFQLFDVTETKNVECDTISSSLSSLKISYLDYLKIDTQGAELEILKGLGDYRPLLIKCEVQIFPMYKGVPSWTELVNFLEKLNYIVCDWKEIGSHATRTPVEMDMIFIPNFSKDIGKKSILERQNEFISLMLISGQIKILKKISKIINLGHSEDYMNVRDLYFD